LRLSTLVAVPTSGAHRARRSGAGEPADPHETILAMRVRIELNPPMLVQYFAFLDGALRGDCGDSAWLSVSPGVAILIVTIY
jgi:ABC-type dipeptide/oligopeptide/nickel transport system permease component